MPSEEAGAAAKHRRDHTGCCISTEVLVEPNYSAIVVEQAQTAEDQNGSRRDRSVSVN